MSDRILARIPSPQTGRLRLLAESISLPAVHVEDERIYLNAHAQHLSGYNNQDLQTVQDWFAAMFTPLQAAEAVIRHEEERKLGFSESRTWSLKTKRGETVHTVFTACAHHTEELWLFHDVSEHHHTEHQLLQSVQLMRAVTALQRAYIVDRTPAPLFDSMLHYMLDLTESSFGMIGEIERGPHSEHHLNIRAIESFGWDYSARAHFRRALPILKFRDLQDFIPGIIAKLTPKEFDLDGIRFLAIPLFRGPEMLGAVILGGRTVSYSQRLQHQVEPMIQTCANLLESIERERARQEATEALKSSQEALKIAKEAAEAGSLAKSQFLATMSHEIRTPMNGIIGMTELLRDTAMSSDQTECVETIKSCAEGLLEIISDILDLSKIEAGRMEVERRAFNLEKLIHDTLKPFRVSAKQKGLELMVRVDQQVGAFRVGDELRIRQLLLNLLSNALKFTEKGHVSLYVRLIDEAESLVRFSVIDTGRGISKEKQASIFEAFIQADQSTTRQFGGTGLGLTICKKLVELLGGQIGVTGDLNAGSHFYFDLPLPRAQEHHAVLPKHARRALSRPLHVLVADDNAVNRRIVQRFLSKAGHETTLVENGLEAVEATRRTAFDMILMDLQMPLMDGYEATAKIRATEQEGQRLPIVALTANAMHGDAEISLAAGMDAHLTKPITKNALLSAIERYASANIARIELQPPES